LGLFRGSNEGKIAEMPDFAEFVFFKSGNNCQFRFWRDRILNKPLPQRVFIAKTPLRIRSGFAKLAENADFGYKM
jgi:hypothetical protein